MGQCQAEFSCCSYADKASDITVDGLPVVKQNSNEYSILLTETSRRRLQEISMNKGDISI